LRREEEIRVTTSSGLTVRCLRNDPASGRQASGTRGQAGLGGHAGVRGGRTSWTGGRPPTMARRPPARTRCGPCGSRRGHGDGAAGHGSGTATSAGHSCVQGRRAWSASGRLGHAYSPCGTSAARLQARPDTSTVAVRPAVQVPDTPRTDCRIRCDPAAAVATGTARRVGGRWWDAVNAGGREPAGRSGGRGAGRGRRSSPDG
jgi:hypothetical protein